MSDAIIKLNNVSKSYGSTKALDRVSLEVPSGCVYALLGENGAGKTTALKTILGLEKPSHGSVEVLGMNPSRNGINVRRRIGYVPDAPALYDWMKVSQIAWFTAGFYPDGFVERFNHLAARFELPLEKKIKSLSKGGRAKVTLALAMAHEPELLVLDEPTSGLDTLVRRTFLESMVDVAASGRSVLISSHQIPEVERVADRLAIIHEGRLLVSSKLDDLKQQLERWVITFQEVPAALPPFVGTILSHDGEGKRRQQVVVRDPDPNALWQLRDHQSVLEVEVHTPNLEEIFVAFLKSNNRKDGDLYRISRATGTEENLGSKESINE